MPTSAFVFPGQGSQTVGMGRALARSSPAAAAVFALADDALGESISTLAWDGPADRLDRTENAQPALLATSIAYLAALRQRRSEGGLADLEPAFYAGHSMGQYSAMVGAGVLGLGDALRLVRERGRLMQASGDEREGRMAAIIGLDEARLPELADGARAYGEFDVANRNSPGQVVVSGERRAVEASLVLARELGAKRAIELPVSVAAHSSLMIWAVDGLREAVEGVTFADPSAPLLTNLDASLITTGAQARHELLMHLITGVDWVLAVQTMAAAGVERFIEIGPGRVLTGLIKRIVPDLEALATDAPNATDGLAVPDLETLPQR